ncbi:MAG: Hsp33 family molecular chaperone HslO, partial [Clostridia bacterium]
MVRSAGGFLIQLLPGADEDTISKVEKIIEKAKPVTTMLEEKTSLEDIAKNLLNGFEIEILDGFETAYTCDCSRQRVERALLTTGKEQLQEIIETDGQAQLDCHFCFKKYKFTKDDLEQLVKQMS